MKRPTTGRLLATRTCVAIAVVSYMLISLAGCGDNVAKQKAAAEAQRASEPASGMATAAQSGTAGGNESGAQASAVAGVVSGAGAASGAADSAPAAEHQQQADEPAPVVKSKFHPAAKGVDYDYIDQVWETEEDREIIDYLTRAATAEKGYRIIKKNPGRYLPLLRRAIRADHREVRIQTAVILGLLKDKSHETFLVLKDCVLLDSDPDVRAIAAKAFVVLKTKDAVDVLIRSLNEDPYEAARANAAWALGSIGHQDAVPHLRVATKDDDTFVRLRSVSALFKLKAKAAIPELIDRLEDKSPMVRERAHEALREITGTDKGKERDPWARAFIKSAAQPAVQ